MARLSLGLTIENQRERTMTEAAVRRSGSVIMAAILLVFSYQAGHAQNAVLFDQIDANVRGGCTSQTDFISGTTARFHRDATCVASGGGVGAQQVNRAGGVRIEGIVSAIATVPERARRPMLITGSGLVGAAQRPRMALGAA